MTESDTEKDPGAKQISFHEEFRKAKRNVLFWGVLTILLAVGTVNAESVDPSSLIRGISLPPVPLVVGSAAILIFMFLGYWRAEQHLIIKNREFTDQHDIGEAIKVIIALRDDLKDKSMAATTNKDRLVRIHNVTRDAQMKIGLEVQEARDQLMNVDDLRDALAPPTLALIGLARSGEYPSMDTTTPNQQHHALQYVRNTNPVAVAAEDWIKHRIAKFAGALNTAWEGAQTDIKQVKSNEDDIETSATQADNRITNLLTGLNSWATGIGLTEKRWFIGYDRGVVWLVTALALLVAAVRICMPTSFPDWMVVEDQSAGIQ